MDIQTIDKDLLNELLQRALNSERHQYAYDMRNSPADTSQRILNTLFQEIYAVEEIIKKEDAKGSRISELRDELARP